MKRVIFIAVLAACSGRQNQANREMQEFECHDRRASYVAIKHIAGEELGVLIDCAETGPRIKRWKIEKSGQRLEDERAITPSDFNKVWKEIDGTGWALLKNCANGSLDKRDPVYQFDIKDDTNKATFECQTREVPYPYNDITDALDLMAAQGHKQLGDDEPPEAKALEHKDKNR